MLALASPNSLAIAGVASRHSFRRGELYRDLPPRSNQTLESILEVLPQLIIRLVDASRSTCHPLKQFRGTLLEEKRRHRTTEGIGGIELGNRLGRDFPLPVN
jgi:hypothetical protein